MKKIFRFVGFSGLLTVALAAGAVASFAQDPCADVDGANKLYQEEVLPNYKSNDPAVIQKAIDAAKSYLEKYGSCEPFKPQVDWMKPKVPAWEARKKSILDGMAFTALVDKFNNGYKTSNWDDVYAGGKDIIASPQSDDSTKLDVTIVLGYTGFEQATKKNNKYNDEALNYARSALQKIDSGVTSKAYGIAFPTSNVTFGTKENAVGWMNLAIGYILFDGKNDQKGALSYLYQASKSGPETPANPIVYEHIGRYFFADVLRLTDELKVLAADVHDTDAEDVAAKKQADIKAKKALINGTIERALDAYSRAYKNSAKADQKAMHDSVYQKIQQLYQARFQKTDGVDAYIASITAKPLVDPTSPVTPIEDAEVKADANKTTVAPAKPSTVPAKPATSNSVKSGATATTKDNKK